MQGVITRVQVLAHPIVIVESFGLKVLVRALLADRGETVLDIVSCCAEEEARSEMEEFDLVRTVNRFIGFECRARDLCRQFSQQFAGLPEAAKFFATLSWQEEGHAILLSRVRREIRRGRVWAESKDLHLASVGALDALLAGFEEEARRGISLARPWRSSRASRGRSSTSSSASTCALARASSASSSSPRTTWRTAGSRCGTSAPGTSKPTATLRSESPCKRSCGGTVVQHAAEAQRNHPVDLRDLLLRGKEYGVRFLT